MIKEYYNNNNMEGEKLSILNIENVGKRRNVKAFMILPKPIATRIKVGFVNKM